MLFFLEEISRGNPGVKSKILRCRNRKYLMNIKYVNKRQFMEIIKIKLT